MTAEANMDVAPHPNQQVTTMASHLWDFTRIKPLIFYASNDYEDLQEFLDEVYKVLYVVGVSSSEKAELASCQLKDMAQTWYVEWRDNRPLTVGTMTWRSLRRLF